MGRRAGTKFGQDMGLQGALAHQGLWLGRAGLWRDEDWPNCGDTEAGPVCPREVAWSPGPWARWGEQEQEGLVMPSVP